MLSSSFLRVTSCLSRVVASLHELDQADNRFSCIAAAFGRRARERGQSLRCFDVLLSATRALKLKKAARFAHIDLSTPESRFAACQVGNCA